MTERGWNVIDAERGVLWHEYEFRKGALATTLVFRGPEGLVVISPGSGLSPAAYDELEKYGEVCALVANNSFHNLGQKPWRDRFPKAHSYAASAMCAKLDKKVPGAKFRSTDELSLPEGARCHVMPGSRTGEVMVSLSSREGAIWYTGDLLTNIRRTPGPPFSWLFKWTDSGPGYRLFKMNIAVFVNDKGALKERMVALFDETPPAIVVPGHGPVVTGSDVAQQTKTQVARL